MKRLYLALIMLFGSLFAHAQCQYKCDELHIGVHYADCNFVNLCVFTPTNVKINNVCLDYEIKWFIGSSQIGYGECVPLYPANSPNIILAEVTLWAGGYGNSPILCRDTLTFDFKIENYCCKKFDLAPHPDYPNLCDGGVLCLYDEDNQLISALEGYDVVWSDGELGQCNGITAVNHNTELCAYITRYAGSIPNSPIICRDTVCQFISCDSCMLDDLSLQPLEFYPTPCDTSFFRVLLGGQVVNATNFPNISLTWPDGSHGTVYGPVVGGVCVLVQQWAGVPFNSNLICERTICWNCCRSFHIDFHPEYSEDPCKGALLCLYDDVTNQPIGNYPQYDNVIWSDGSMGGCTWVDQSDAPEICAYIHPTHLRNCRDTVCFTFVCGDSCMLSGYTVVPIKSADPCNNAYFAVQDVNGDLVTNGGNITFLWNNGSSDWIIGPISGGACVELTLWAGEPYKSEIICTVKICYDCRRGEPRSSIDIEDGIKTMVTENSISVLLPEKAQFDKVSMNTINGVLLHEEALINRRNILISTEDLPAGMYILQFRSSISVEVVNKKIMLIK